MGDRLPDALSLLDKKERLAQLPMPLGALAGRASFSMTTGCWSIVDAWRNDKGYAFVWDAEPFGYETSRARDFKGVQVHRMAYNMKRRGIGLPDLIRYQQLDHICRWPGCCNVDHLAVVDHVRNNKLRDQARRLEAALAAGQTILGPTRLDWLDNYLESVEIGDTSLIITTPSGPYRVVKSEDDPVIFYAEPEFSGLLEVVRPPAVKKYQRPSRAKRQEIPTGQDMMFDLEPYRSKAVQAAKLYRAWQKTAVI